MNTGRTKVKENHVEEKTQLNKTENGTKASLEIYKKIIESIPMGIVVLELEKPADFRTFRIIETNDAANKASGINLKKFVGKTLYESFPVLYEETDWPKQYLEVIEKGIVKNIGEIEYEDAKIKKRVFSLSAHPLSGNYIYLCYENITQKKQAEKDLKTSETIYSALIESFAHVVWVGNSQGDVTYLNQAWKKWTGRKIEDSLGTAWAESVHPDDIAPLLAKWERAYKHGEPYNGECRFMAKDGSIIYCSFIGLPIKDDAGKITNWVGIDIDITELKKSEEALKSLNKNLEQQVAKRTSALEQLEAKYHDLYENAPDMFVSVDAKTKKIRECNQLLVNNLGYKKDEIIGKPLFFIYHPDCLDDVKKVFQSFTETGKVHNEELQLRQKNGSKIDVMLNVSAVMGEKGNEIHCMCILRDITNMKELEKKFKKLLETAPDAIVIVNKKGHIVLVNQQTENLFGYSSEELIGQEVELLMPVKFRNKHQGHRAGYARNPGFRPMGAGLELYGIHKKGREFPIEISLSPLDMEKEILYSSTIRDITERKNTERLLKEYAAELEKSNEELELFAYVASHDLQEPLRVIISYMGLLEKRYMGQLDEKATKYIDNAVSASCRMRNLIDDLLTYSRLTTICKSFRKTNLTKTIKQVYNDLEISIKENKAKVYYNKLPIVKSDKTQMYQLFSNLVGNAIKFRKPDKAPEIYIGATRQGKEWIISVRDNGIGIKKEYFDKIFVIFQKLHTRLKYGGTGFGLAICKKIIEQHGGTIWLESKPGKGSTFYFSLPA